jgi:hypothetical protein
MLTSQKDPESPYLGPKTLPRWIALDYFRRLRPLRGRRKWVTLAFFLSAGALAAWSVQPGHHWAHQAGPLSTAHAMFSDDCTRCHTISFQPLVRLVSGDAHARSTPDAACLQCHDGAVHHEMQAHTFHCAECHREHRGKPALAEVANGRCTTCHQDLRKDHPHTLFRDVADFAGNHPEFARIARAEKDTTKLRFNHRYHLELDLQALREKGAQGLAGYGDKLECVACHRPDAERRTMLPINYDRHCAQCHTLWVPLAGQFQDPQAAKAADEFRRRPAPHKEPATVRAELRERLLAFVRDNPVALGRDAGTKPAVLGRTPAEKEWFWAKSQLQKAEDFLFTQQQLPRAEQLLWNGGGGCQHCHLEKGSRGPGGLPEYEPTGIPKDAPRRWFEHSIFRHDAHRMLGCVECHAQANRSEATGDLLLPAIATCHRCHTPKAGARTDCVECHQYHDRKKERGLNGNLTIEK